VVLPFFGSNELLLEKPERNFFGANGGSSRSL